MLFHNSGASSEGAFSKNKPLSICLLMFEKNDPIFLSLGDAPTYSFFSVCAHTIVAPIFKPHAFLLQAPAAP